MKCLNISIQVLMPRTKDSEHYEIGYAAFLKSSVQLEQNSTERQTLNHARLHQCDSGNVACVVSVKYSVGVCMQTSGAGVNCSSVWFLSNYRFEFIHS
jgi:hypothetical protein